VVNLHGGSINVGFKSLKRIRKIGNEVSLSCFGVGSDNSGGSSDGGTLFEKGTTRVRPICGYPTKQQWSQVAQRWEKVNKERKICVRCNIGIESILIWDSQIKTCSVKFLNKKKRSWGNTTITNGMLCFKTILPVIFPIASASRKVMPVDWLFLGSPMSQSK